MQKIAFALMLCSLTMRGQSAGQTRFKPNIPGIVEGRTVESKLMEIISVADFGADPTGMQDSLPAFNAARQAASSPGRIFVPRGVYSLGGQFAMQANNLHLICEAGAEIRYTGTASVDSVVLMGNYTGKYGPSTYFNQSIDSCTIRGNTHVNAVLHVSNAASTRVSNVNLKEGLTCLLVDYGNTDLMDHVLCTQYNGLMRMVPTTGIWLNHMNNVRITAPSVEDLCSTPAGNRCVDLTLPPATGIKMTNVAAATVEDGTSEGNSIAVDIVESSSIYIHNMDNEKNATADVQASGAQIHIEGGVQMYFVHIKSPCYQCTVEGVSTGQITIDSGAVGTQVTNNAYANTDAHGNSITDNGTGTTILNNRSTNGGAFFENKLYGMQISGDLSSIGLGAPPAGKSDDPAGFMPALQAKSDFIKLGLGPRQTPTCDATHGHGDVWYDQGTAKVTGAFKICIKDASDQWDWRTLYADGAGFNGKDTYLAACSLQPTMAVACADAGCASKIPVVTSIAISCPTGNRTFRNGLAQP